MNPLPETTRGSWVKVGRGWHRVDSDGRQALVVPLPPSKIVPVPERHGLIGDMCDGSGLPFTLKWGVYEAGSVEAQVNGYATSFDMAMSEADVAMEKEFGERPWPQEEE